MAGELRIAPRVDHRPPLEVRCRCCAGPRLVANWRMTEPRWQGKPEKGVVWSAWTAHERADAPDRTVSESGKQRRLPLPAEPRGSSPSSPPRRPERQDDVPVDQPGEWLEPLTPDLVCTLTPFLAPSLSDQGQRQHCHAGTCTAVFANHQRYGEDSQGLAGEPGEGREGAKEERDEGNERTKGGGTHPNKKTHNKKKKQHNPPQTTPPPPPPPTPPPDVHQPPRRRRPRLGLGLDQTHRSTLTRTHWGPR